MYLRRYIRNKDGKTHIEYAFVESERTDTGPQERGLAYLGEFNDDRQPRWHLTVVIYNRQGDSRQLRLFSR